MTFSLTSFIAYLNYCIIVMLQIFCQASIDSDDCYLFAVSPEDGMAPFLLRFFEVEPSEAVAPHFSTEHECPSALSHDESSKDPSSDSDSSFKGFTNSTDSSEDDFEDNIFKAKPKSNVNAGSPVLEPTPSCSKIKEKKKKNVKSKRKQAPKEVDDLSSSSSESEGENQVVKSQTAEQRKKSKKSFSSKAVKRISKFEAILKNLLDPLNLSDEDSENASLGEDSDEKSTAIKILKTLAKKCDKLKNEKSSCTAEKEKEEKKDDTVPCLKNLQVLAIDKRYGDKKMKFFDQRASCYYCAKKIQKLPRHLEDLHGEEDLVKEFLALPKNSLPRKRLLSKIRNLGNQKENKKVIEVGTGFMIPKYRSRASRDGTVMLLCPKCGGLYAGRSLCKHLRRCTSDLGDIPENCSTTDLKKMARMETCYIPEGHVLERVSDVLDGIRDQAVRATIESDPVILEYGAKRLMLLGKGASLRKNLENARSRMRQCAKIIDTARIITGNPNFTMSEFFKLDTYETTFKVAHKIGGFNAKTFEYTGSTSFGIKFKQHLNHAAFITRKGYSLTRNKTLRDELDEAYLIIEKEWGENVSYHCRRQLNVASFNQPTALPPTTQITKVYMYLKTRRVQLVEDLRNSKSPVTFRALAGNLFTRLVYFNRRRVGEVESMLLEWYNKKVQPGQSGMKSPLEESLTDIEHKLLKFFVRIELRGKKGRKVPILFTPDMVYDTDLLVATRADCSVNPENPYLFPLTRGEMSHVSGYPLMRKAATDSGVDNAYMYTGTNIRKVFATSLQLLSLEKNNLREFASYLGHDFEVHKHYYRLQSDVFQVTKIGKVLMESVESQLNKNVNRGLNDLQFTTEELQDIAARENGMDAEPEVQNVQQLALQVDPDDDLDRAAPNRPGMLYERDFNN